MPRPPRLRPCHSEIFHSWQCRCMACIPKRTTETHSKGFVVIGILTRAPLGGGGYFESPSCFLAIFSKPMQVSPPNLQYPLSQHLYTLY